MVNLESIILEYQKNLCMIHFFYRTLAFTCGHKAQQNSRQVQVYSGSFLSDDQQSHVGNDIEDQKDDFEQPEERVNDHVEGFSGNGKPFALRTVHQIRGQHAHGGPEDQQGSVYDCAPHEESCQRLNIHDSPFLIIPMQR